MTRIHLYTTALLCAAFLHTLPAQAATNDYYALSRVTYPGDGAAQSYGGYAGGCLDGGVRLDEDGEGYRLMRLSRGRYWMHPELKDYITGFAYTIKQRHPWQGLLIGDTGGAIGGPLLSGHRSHQNGLDVDIWLDPMPARPFSYDDREKISATSHVTRNMQVRDSWTRAHTDAVLTAAADARVARIFLNAALKKRMCADTGGNNPLLRKIRPWYGHDDHIHVRLTCPSDSVNCQNQAPPPPGTGCSGNDLDWWFSKEAAIPAKKKDDKPKPKPKKKTLSDLPAVCRALLR